MSFHQSPRRQLVSLPGQRPRRSDRRIRPFVSGALVLSFAGIGGLTLFAPTASVSAANVAVEQCNGVSNSGGLTVQCNVMIVNNLTDDPSTTGSIVTMNGAAVESPDIVTSVTQCNGSANGG